ncbi:MAG: YqjK-like family protein [Burkholderiaceae bacterium]|jgi:hypothetical protein|nr:YqjK-like family protein [Burkholderiaceae bacterium]
MNRSAHSRQDLADRRAALLLRSAQLREQLAWRAQVLRPAVRAADKVHAGARWARRNPVWLLLGAAALTGVALTRPRAALRLAGRAWSGWLLLRRAWPVAASLLRRLN